MKVIAVVYGAYIALMLASLAVHAAFGEDHCGLLDCEPGYSYNWADKTFGFASFLLAILFAPVTVAFAIAFVVAAVVAASRRRRAVTHP